MIALNDDNLRFARVLENVQKLDHDFIGERHLVPITGRAVLCGAGELIPVRSTKRAIRLHRIAAVAQNERRMRD